MTRHLARTLAALLLALPLRAQTVRVTGSFTPAFGAPALTGLGSPVAITPLALSPLSAAPSLALSLPASALTPELALQPSIAPVSLIALDVTIPADAQPSRTSGVQAATPVDGWASRFNFKPGAQVFDGSTLKDETGAVFTAIPKGDGAVRVHILEQGPLAPTKAVPGTEGLNGRALLGAINAFASKGHAARTYNETSDYMFSTADQVVINGVKGVVDAYSGIFVPGTSKEGGDYPEKGDPNGDGYNDKDGMNVEHTWPQSLFQKALPQRSDIHHLMATFMHPNSVRGSLPFGIVVGKPDYENKAGAKRGRDANGKLVFEPPNAVKGRVARSQLYFYSRHKDSRMFGRTSVEYWNGELDVLMKWNRDYAPSAFEARRNDLGEQWQGNRNPFIDDHLLADRVGADAFRAGNPSRGADVASFRSSGRQRPSSRRFSRR